MALELRSGCCSWTSPAWTGRFYPEGLPSGDRLAWYAQYFDAVEVDATYYAVPQRSVVRGWGRRTPEKFRFTLKFPRDLLDPKRRVPEGAVRSFVEVGEELGSKLGAILLQFPPWFRAPAEPGAGLAGFLENRLRELPSGPRYAVELREAGWFAGGNRDWLVRLLTQVGAASCWSSLTYVDIPPVRTARWAYLRFIGDHTTIPAATHGEVRVDRTSETRRWVEVLRGSELESAFAFFNNHFAGYAPASVNLFRREMGLPTVELPSIAPSAASVAAQRRLDV